MTDFSIFQFINQFAGRWVLLDAIGIFFANYSGYVLAAILVGFLFFGNRKRNFQMTIEAFLAAIFSRFVVVNIIRAIYPKSRPFVNHQVYLLIRETGNSFPSGHASFFFALSFTVYFFNKKLGIAFLIISFLMGIARIFVGVHYPSDILGGILVGYFSAWLVNKYSQKFLSKHQTKISSNL
ncbi:MAG TPA: phosphatase PAP2 family protein [Candidatus Pacearchaeota archaeon]|nr:phosphatase PAP2 family protein [Candidatus Pacearchaeota archaeon]HOK94333.1 phosphatase PAP2 family protein [Candidatus Pacearchaeota archaeon]HPO75284.1 phosphatase PAP2 family protein [Candidatus Pacearchaeota archaeon]